LDSEGQAQLIHFLPSVLGQLIKVWQKLAKFECASTIFLTIVHSACTAALIRKGDDDYMVEEISSSDIDRVVSENRIVFIDCHAVWCGPCRTLSPILEELDEKYSDKGFKVVKLDVDQNREFSMENRITGVPSVLVFSDGQRVIFDDGRGSKSDKLIGVMPPEVYTQIIEDLLAVA